MKSLNNILLFLIPKRISYTVWFAPFAIGIGIYGCFNGYTSLGIGALLGGVLLVFSYFLKHWLLKSRE